MPKKLSFRLAVENGLSALGLRAVELVLKALCRGRRGEWPHRRVLDRIPGLHLLHLLRELREEVVIELVYDDEPLRGVTRLARVVDARLHRGVDDLVEVLGREHDERVGASHLEDHLLQVPPGDLGDGGARSLGAGDRDTAHARVGITFSAICSCVAKIVW